ncbi:hypothetical protein KAU09_03910 [Candidatus Parcubacteria bacterium]|nr:hypothetical protein [Candidatus Parcubacteria bacterium]
MNFISLLCYSSFIALGFSGWAIAGNFSGANAAWVGSVMVVGAGMIVPVLSAKKLLYQSPPGLLSILILVIASVVNAAAVHMYAGKVNLLKPVQTGITAGIFVATVSILMVVFGVLLDFLLNHKTISTSQMCGVGTAVLTIFLMSR